MKKLIVGIALATTVLGGAAIAAQADNAVKPDPAKEAGWLAKRGDANGDGAVSREEFMAKAAADFAKLDANKDGKITPDEFKAAMQARWAEHRGHRHGPGEPGGPGMMPPPGGPGMPPPPPGGRPGMIPPPHGPGGPGGPGGMLMQLDTNKDGKISREEFNAPNNKRFDMLDTNKDGQIDQAEIAAAREKMRAEMQKMRGAWHDHHGPDGGATPPPPPPSPAKVTGE